MLVAQETGQRGAVAAHLVLVEPQRLGLVVMVVRDQLIQFLDRR